MLLLLLKILGILVAVVLLLSWVSSMVGGYLADRKFKPLDVRDREPVPFDDFFHQHFEQPGDPPMDKELVRSALDYVARMSTLPADRLRLEDSLGRIAAVAGLKRAPFLAVAMGEFREAEFALMTMMRDGHMDNLSQFLVTVALGTVDARRAKALHAAQAQQAPPQESA